MVEACLGTCWQWVAPSLGTVSGFVPGTRRERIETAIRVEENLRVVERVGVRAVHAGVAGEEVSVARTRIDWSPIGERSAAVGGVGGTAEGLTACEGIEIRSFKHAARVIEAHDHAIATTHRGRFTLRETGKRRIGHIRSWIRNTDETSGRRSRACRHNSHLDTGNKRRAG